MDLITHRCKGCGGELTLDGQQYTCPYCGRRYDQAVAERDTATLQEQFDEQKRERIHNLRRLLYDAVTATYISREEVLRACEELRQYLPEDFAANFFKVAAGRDMRRLNQAIREIDADSRYEEIGTVVSFLVKSLTSDADCLLALNDLVERTYKKRDTALFSRYATLVSRQAEKVQEGIYETGVPRDVFVAYSSKDMDRVIELTEALEEQGITCFVAARNLRHGVGSVEDYDSAIKEAIDNCRTVVFVSGMNSRNFACDALKVELAYIQAVDLQNAPAEYRNDYATMPRKYKKSRVEYRIEESTRPNIGDTRVDLFFSGYERVYTIEGVLERLVEQLYAMPTFGEASPAASAPVAPPAQDPIPQPPPRTGREETPPAAAPLPYEVGSTIRWGTYEQGHGKEPIEWLVLAKEDDRALVISKYVLDCQKYHKSSGLFSKITWETSSVRQWLNQTFLNEAFSTAEQDRICSAKVVNSSNLSYRTKGGNDTVDRLFFLSMAEATTYFVSDAARKARATEFAKMQGVFVSQMNGNSCWWLRTPGYFSSDVADVYHDGTINPNGYSADCRDAGVRPAMWIKI